MHRVSVSGCTVAVVSAHVDYMSVSMHFSKNSIPVRLFLPYGNYWHDLASIPGRYARDSILFVPEYYAVSARQSVYQEY